MSICQTKLLSLKRLPILDKRRRWRASHCRSSYHLLRVPLLSTPGLADSTPRRKVKSAAAPLLGFGMGRKWDEQPWRPFCETRFTLVLYPYPRNSEFGLGLETDLLNENSVIYPELWSMSRCTAVAFYHGQLSDEIIGDTVPSLHLLAMVRL